MASRPEGPAQTRRSKDGVSWHLHITTLSNRCGPPNASRGCFREARWVPARRPRICAPLALPCEHPLRRLPKPTLSKLLKVTGGAARSDARVLRHTFCWHLAMLGASPTRSRAGRAPTSKIDLVSSSRCRQSGRSRGPYRPGRPWVKHRPAGGSRGGSGAGINKPVRAHAGQLAAALAAITGRLGATRRRFGRGRLLSL